MHDTRQYVDPLGEICVLDIETGPDASALETTARRSGAVPAALHHVRDASLLRAMEANDGSWVVSKIVSTTPREREEEDVVRFVDQQLASVLARGGTLITYNGLRFDLPFLRRRAAAHLMFDLPGLVGADSSRHIDVMTIAHARRDGKWAELRHAAQSLGIPTSHQVPAHGIGATSAGVRKSQLDVAMTFLVLLFELSIMRRDAGAVIDGWRALGRYIAEMGPHGDHLAQFRRHPLGGSLDALR